MYKVADLSPTHFRKQSYSRHRWYQARSKILVSRVWGLDSGPNLQPFMLAEYTYTGLVPWESRHGGYNGQRKNPRTLAKPKLVFIIQKTSLLHDGSIENGIFTYMNG